MNHKGFTLSELIVTIALMGVVMAIAFPAITKLQTQNQRKVYETYENVLLTGAKLYVDKYGRDLWVNPVTSDSCVIIKYEYLLEEDLIKEFDGLKKGETVDMNNTFVIATKKKNDEEGNTTVTYEVSFVVKKGSSYTYKNILYPVGCSSGNAAA